VSHRASGTKARPEALAGGLDFVGGYDAGAEHTRFLGAVLLFAATKRPRAGEWISFPPPALSEGRHCRLACLGIAVRRRAIFVMPEGERPHPRRAYG
jgi:hypothetical protein